MSSSWPDTLAAMAAMPVHLTHPSLAFPSGPAHGQPPPASADDVFPVSAAPHAPSMMMMLSGGGGGSSGTSGSLVKNEDHMLHWSHPDNKDFGGGGGNGGSVIKKEDRIPQWSHQETKDFIAIRSELKKDFNQTKRNKSLWEAIATKMKERGHKRSADQCKCKWKNLHNRYKAMAVTQGAESGDFENWRPCPFYEELNAIFSEPDSAPAGLLAESGKRKGRKGQLGDRSSDEISDGDEDEDDDSEEEGSMRRSTKKLRKGDARERTRSSADKGRASSMQEVLEEFFQQQARIEREWLEALAIKEEERRKREQEWRETMERLEQERLARESRWREREEQRRVREEARAEKRDALLSVLVSRLVKEG